MAEPIAPTAGRAELRAARSAGAMILASEGRHGRPDTFHLLTDPQFTCEPHEYMAVVPWAGVVELIEADKAYDAALAALKEHCRLVAESGYVAARTGDAREISTRFVTAEIRRARALDRLLAAGGAQ